MAEANPIGAVPEERRRRPDLSSMVADESDTN
jgi:hypothetical protein